MLRGSVFRVLTSTSCWLSSLRSSVRYETRKIIKTYFYAGGWVDVTSSVRSSTLARSVSNSCSIISMEPFSLASFTSSSCPVICCTDVANRFKKTRQLSSLTMMNRRPAKAELSIAFDLQIVKHGCLLHEAIKNCEKVYLHMPE